MVLEGGGALGFAHIGVIRYLEEHHIPVDLVVGTSMGGLVAGLYATGRSPADIQQLTGDIDWDEVLSGRTGFQHLNFRRKEDRQDFPNRLEFGLKHKKFTFPAGLNSGHQVGLVLDRATLAYQHNLNFDNLPIPFRCVATDITEGQEKIFDRGSISQALRATMSIPGVFAPVTIDGHVYTDGGAVDNLPVDVAKQAGADIVIAAYLDPGPVDPATYNSILSIAARNVSIMISANELHNMKAADVLLSADLSGFNSFDFKRGNEIIPKGYQAAEKKRQMLKGFALNDKDWQEYIAARNAKVQRDVPIPQFLRVNTTNPDYRRALTESLAQYVDKAIDPPQLENSLTQITGGGYMSSLGYSVTDKLGQPGLDIRTYEKNYGPPFVNVGINIDGADPDNVLFGMAARLTFLDLGGYRSEWRSDAYFGSTYGADSEYYRPFSWRSKFFYAPRIFAGSSPFNIYGGHSRLFQYRVERDGLGFDLGYAINARSEFRIGEALQWFKSVRKIGDDTAPDTSQRQVVSSMRYRYFGTDNIVLPRRGVNIEASANWYQQSQGYPNFPQAELKVSYFQPISKNGSVIFIGSAGSTFGTSSLDLELQSFSLGGPFRLGAFGENELLGSRYFLAQGGYEHRLLSFSPLLGEGLYAVGLFEAGKVSDPLINVSGFGLEPDVPLDGSFALVARTALGPIFVGGSVGNGDHRKWWFGVGHVF